MTAKSFATLAACLLLAAAPARANQIFDFAFSSGATNASGVLTTSNLHGNTYTILDVTGSIDGFPIAGLAPPGSFFNPKLPTDNLLYATGSLLDGGGFIIEPGDLGTLGEAHVSEQIGLDTNAADFGLGLYTASIPGFGPFANGSFTVANVTPAAVSEPAALAMLGSGMVALALTRRRARRGAV